MLNPELLAQYVKYTTSPDRQGSCSHTRYSNLELYERPSSAANILSLDLPPELSADVLAIQQGGTSSDFGTKLQITQRIQQYLQHAARGTRFFTDLVDGDAAYFRGFTNISKSHTGIIDFEGISEHHSSVIHFATEEAVLLNLENYGCEAGQKQQFIFADHNFLHSLGFITGEGLKVIGNTFYLSIYEKNALQKALEEGDLIRHEYNGYLLAINSYHALRQAWKGLIKIGIGQKSDDQIATEILSHNELQQAWEKERLSQPT